MKSLQNYSILYVEDEPKLRDSYSSFLKRYFKEVRTASDGMEALQLYGWKRPDIILCDILLPKIDGLTLLEKIRKEDDKTRIVMTTAYSDKERLLKATELNITKYLIKPIRKDALIEALEKAISQLEKISPSLVRFGNGFVYDRNIQSLTWRGEKILLSKNENIFLSILSENHELFLSIEEICEKFYLDFDKDISMDGIKSLIKRLKRKAPEELIENRFAVGYRLAKRP